MALNDTVTAMNLIDMVEFDKDSRLVRKKLIQ